MMTEKIPIHNLLFPVLLLFMAATGCDRQAEPEARPPADLGPLRESLMQTAEERLPSSIASRVLAFAPDSRDREIVLRQIRDSVATLDGLVLVSEAEADHASLLIRLPPGAEAAFLEELDAFGQWQTVYEEPAPEARAGERQQPASSSHRLIEVLLNSPATDSQQP